MELRDYVKIIGQQIWFLIIVILLITISAIFFTLRTPESYDGSVSFYVSKKAEIVKVNDYQYDEYYAIKASSLIADTIMTWLQDPSNVIEIYNSANLDLPTEELNKLTKVIQTRKKEPAAINVTMSGSDEKTVKNLLNSTIAFVKKQEGLDSSFNAAENFNIGYSNTTVLRHQKSLLLNSVLAFIVGLVFGIGLIFLVKYFKPKHNNG